jgi:hypothetical protein
MQNNQLTQPKKVDPGKDDINPAVFLGIMFAYWTVLGVVCLIAGQSDLFFRLSVVGPWLGFIAGLIEKNLRPKMPENLRKIFMGE